MKTHSIAFLASLAFGPALALPALAQQAGDVTTARDLAELCSARDAADRNLCNGVLYGALITTRAYNAVETNNGDRLIAAGDRIICAPNGGISLGEMREEYLRWYDTEPQARQMNATNAVFTFMADHWRCDNARTAERANDPFDRRVYLNENDGGGDPTDIFSDIFRALER